MVKSNKKRRYITYTSTWNSSIDDFALENIPNYITDINLSFVFPDTRYEKGSYDFSESVTGLEFIEGATIDSIEKRFTEKDTKNLLNRITALQERGTDVFIALGGWLYSQTDAWENFSAKHIVDLAVDLGVKGIDIDWERVNNLCNEETADKFACPKDSEIIGIVTDLHNEIDKQGLDLELSLTGWATGAFYVKDTPFEKGKVKSDSPAGGNMYRVLKDHGDKLSFVNIMSYDSGKFYDPREGYESYRSIYDGVINLGFQIGPEGARDAILNLRAPEGVHCDDHVMDGRVIDTSNYYNVETLVDYIKKHGKESDGFFLWELWKHRRREPLGGKAASVTSLGQYLCKHVPLEGDCTQIVPDLPDRKESLQ